MLAPSEMYVGSLGGTKFLMRLNTLPAYAALSIGALLLARLRKPNASWLESIRMGVGWFAAFEATQLVHTSGHIISARAVGAPMDAVIIVYSRQKNAYFNNNVAPSQHIGRALGGPIASGAAALSSYLLWYTRKFPLLSDFLRVWYLFNSAALLIALLPLKPFDGYVLLRWILAAWRK